MLGAGAQREVIAHYSVARLVLLALVWTGFIAVPLYMIKIWSNPGGDPIPIGLYGAAFYSC